MARKANLMLHAGAHRVELGQVIDAPTPPNTATHYPIPHMRLIQTLLDTLPTYSLQVVEQQHALTNDGQRYFGLFQVQQLAALDSDDYCMVFGLRNSHDKKFPAGICLGDCVFVCDNLSFHAEAEAFRRHTLRILNDLPGKFAQVIGQLTAKKLVQDKRIALYKQFELNNQIADHLIMEAGLRAKACLKTQLLDVATEWREPRHPEFNDRTMWSLLNAFTEVFKGTALDALTDRTQKLYGLLDSACGIVDGEFKVVNG